MAHYPAIVEYVWASRFATASQVQRRLADFLPSLRTAQYQLASLVKLGYLQTAPVRSTSPNFPFVYSATGRGVGTVQEAYRRLGMEWQLTGGESARSRGIALHSILHELLLTEFELAVSKSLAGRGDLTRLFSERRYFAPGKQIKFQQRGKTEQVIPDSGFILRSNVQTSERLNVCSPLLLHFVELDNGTMPLPRLAQKLWQYHWWAQSAEGQGYLAQIYSQYSQLSDRRNFRLLLIVRGNFTAAGDEHRLADIFTEALELPSAMRDRLWLTTVSRLAAVQNEPTPLSIPLWQRVRAARKWLTDYKNYRARLPRGRGQKPRRWKRAFVAQRLSQMRRHTLFPIRPVA